MARVALGHDSSWTGWGWCLATDRAPVRVGHVPRLGRRAWRWDALRLTLDALELEVVEGLAMLGPQDPPLRVAVEVAPPVYSGKSRGQVGKDGKPRRAGNQAATGQGLGQLTGPILLWGCQPGRLAYPWALEPGPGSKAKPHGWRSWWLDPRARRPKGRIAWKRWAVQTVELLRWGHHLEPWPWTGDDGGARADVAEAILIAVGSARHHRLGPKGPDPRRSPAWRTP